MAVKIKFDDSYSVIPPTLVLATRSGKKLGAIPASNIVLADHFNSSFDLSFDIYQYYNDEELNLWDSITNFKLIWCADWDLWFEIYVEQTDSAVPVKNVTCVSLAEAELSQVNLYDIEINTEDDIARDDYEVTVLYNPDNPEGSLLHRITEKIPHYTITHVDDRIASIQRTFTFDDISIYDAFQEIAEEIDCIFILDSGTNEDGSIARSIAVYDLEAYCPDCDTRGEFSDVCSECGGTNILPGYGTDTSIYVSVDNLAEDVTFTTDTDSVKNCFRLEGGDDLMTATIRNCNPNGTQYIWYFSDELKADMSEELVAKIAEYDELYSYYQNEHEISLNSDMLSAYNTLVQKYAEYDEDLKEIPDPIIGYPALMQAYYDTIDFYYFLHDEFMPDVSLADTSAEEQAALLTAENLSPVAVQNINSCSSATASSAILAMAKVICDSRYQIKVKTSSYDSDSCYWTGNFTVTNYSDEEDTATSETIELTITGNYEQYVRQKLEKSLNSSADDDDSIATDISGLFNSGLESFKVQIKYYCLTSLTSFYDACQSCLDILVEQGVADFQTWADQDPDLYTELYLDYYKKLGALEDEIALRESEIAVIQGIYDTDGELTDAGLQTYILQARNEIQEILDFEEYLGDDLLLEFAAYRREDLYQNENYISDGLTNAELFANALEFLETAQKEIYKSATQQHSITATLRNLLVMEEFKPIVDNFSVGNWIRVRVDDKVYRLRLVTYEIDFDDLTNFSIEFSDVTEVATGVTDSQSVFAQAASMASSYSEVSSNASKGASSSTYIDYWFETGLDTTNIKLIQGADNQEQTWDSHGMLFRKYDEVENDYSLTQLKIINSTMAITDDGWQTVKTAVGNFYYQDPETGVLKSAYGINGEVLVGKLILGEGLGIYNSANTFTVNEDGMKITNGTNTFLVDPNGDNLLVLSNTSQDLLWVDSSGGLHLRGDGSELDISLNSSITNLSGAITDASASILAEAQSYADESVASLKETVEATYETKDDADSTASTLSSAIATAESNAKSYADGAITTYDTTVKATYETKDDADSTKSTLSSAITSAQEAAESYADSAIATYNTTVASTYETKADADSTESTLSSAIVSAQEAAESYADSAISTYATSVASTYETKADADTTESTLSSAIVSAQEAAESYADSAISSYATTVEATYETQENATTARATILSEAESYADSAIATIQAEVTTLSYKVSHYGTCSTEASATTKAVTCSSFTSESLIAGVIVTVYFTYENTAVAYLNVNNTGSKMILAYGNYLNSGSEYNWKAKSTVQFMYDGSYWKMVDSGAYANLALTIKDGVGVLSANASRIEFNTGELIITSDNFTLDEDGNVTVSGKITATSGTIGGFTIGTSSIYSNSKSSISSSNSGVYIGTSGIACGASSPFKVTSGGVLTATSATITGTLVTTSGSKTAKLSSGGLHFLYDSSDYGSFATTYWTGTNLYGINMNLENAGYFLGFARDDDGDGTYTTAYYISYSTSISSYRHNFTGTEHHSGAITAGSDITLSSGNVLLANTQGVQIKNASGTSKFVLSVSSNNYTNLGNVDLTATQLRANSSYAVFTGTAFYSAGTTLGTSGSLWGQIYSSSSSISTSDRNVKHDINEIADKYMDFYYALTPVSYMKNGGDRIHIGAISQDVLAALESVGLTADDFGGFCRDEKYAYTEYDDAGCPIESTKYVVTDEKGSIVYNYALRYEEFIFLTIEATHRHQETLDDHEARIKELEEKVATLETQLATYVAA